MRNRIFLTIGALVVALVSSPFWLPPLLDWNAFKETFVCPVSAYETALGY
jgi:uncharacterized protein involved in outer membrane biogenesis